jgi:hypothetical protein
MHSLSTKLCIIFTLIMICSTTCGHNISYNTQNQPGIKRQTVSSSNFMARGTIQPRQQDHNVSKHAIPHNSHLWAGPGRDGGMPPLHIAIIPTDARYRKQLPLNTCGQILHASSSHKSKDRTNNLKPCPLRLIPRARQLQLIYAHRRCFDFCDILESTGSSVSTFDHIAKT